LDKFKKIVKRTKALNIARNVENIIKKIYNGPWGVEKKKMDFNS